MAWLPAPLRQAVRIGAAVLVLLVLAGATYQGVATALERRAFPRPGGLVDVGGHQLHIYCTGAGSPTVVLEAAAGAMSPSWGWVQPAVASRTRVCSYDRAGLGWSEAGDDPYTPGRVAPQLRELLRQAREAPPFVLVGHELGAAFARAFASDFGEETAALVLVIEADAGGSPAPAARAWPWLARAGWLRVTGSLATLAAGLPEPSRGAMRAFLNRPDHLTRAAQEIASADGTWPPAPPHLDPGLPVTELTTTSPGRPALLDARARADQVAGAVLETLGALATAGPTAEPGR